MVVAQIPRRFTRSAWGGTETVVLETSLRLAGRGHRVEILCPAALDGREHEEVEGVPVRRFPYFYPYAGLAPGARDRLDRKGGNLFSFSLMHALWEMPGLDLVHLHALKRLGGIGRTVARARGVPYVVTLHGGVHDVPEAEAKSLLAPARGSIEWGKALGWMVGSRRVLDDAALVLCLGPEERERTHAAHPRTRVEVLPNGVDPDRFVRGDGPAFRARHGIPRDARVVLTVGRIDPQKNQRFAVEVLASLASMDARVHAVLVGPVTSDAYLGEVRAAALAAGVDRRLTVVTGLDGTGLVDAYHSADVFLLPSVHEPFGIVVLEAWASGLPVIATRVGGVPSFVDDGRDGLLFDPGDHRGFATAWQALSADASRARALAEAGRRKARERYSWDAVTTRLEALYREVIRGGTAPGRSRGPG